MTTLKIKLFTLFQDAFFNFLVWREKMKRRFNFNRRPRSFWDL